jgi:hypothetical protein
LFANVIGAAALDQLDGLISHADGYPGWARLLFLVSFVLVVARRASSTRSSTRA